jgi:hypothetical protein
MGKAGVPPAHEVGLGQLLGQVQPLTPGRHRAEQHGQHLRGGGGVQLGGACLSVGRGVCVQLGAGVQSHTLPHHDTSRQRVFTLRLPPHRHTQDDGCDGEIMIWAAGKRGRSPPRRRGPASPPRDAAVNHTAGRGGRPRHMSVSPRAHTDELTAPRRGAHVRTVALPL